MPPVYRELQNCPPWWAVAIIVAACVDAWVMLGAYYFYDQQKMPLIFTWVLWLLAGVLLPIFMIALRLIVTVNETGVQVEFIPLMKKCYTYDQIQDVESRTYNAILEYGGWGLRIGRGNKRAYNMRGHKGVELTLVDGSKVMLGSENPTALEAAILAHLK